MYTLYADTSMRKSVIIILVSVIFTLSLTAGFIWYLSPSILTTVTVPFRSNQPRVIIESPDTTLKFTTNHNFPQTALFNEKVHHLVADDNVVEITITSDEKAAEVPFITDKKTVSGFSFPEKKNVYHILVYVAPEIQADRGALQYEITRNYLLGMLYASEYQKYILDVTYTPDYQSAQQISHQITMDAVQQQQFPVVITKVE